MNDSRIPPTDDSGDARASSRYEQWFDGLLDERDARRESNSVRRDPAQSARFEVDQAIEASLRRSFGPAVPKSTAHRGPVSLLHGTPRHAGIRWSRYALAAGVLVVLGAALAITLSRSGDTPKKTGPVAIPEKAKPPTRRHDVVPELVANVGRPRTAVPLGDVFLDALAGQFQPQLGCQSQDSWDTELFAQLETAPCNQEQGVVVLGEWLDPRVDVANMVMLRRGENPIMLVVPRCELDTDLCVPKDSGLYVHRGVRDGRTIFEVSPLPGSEVLGCVDAQGVVTQQQL